MFVRQKMKKPCLLKWEFESDIVIIVLCSQWFYLVDEGFKQSMNGTFRFQSENELYEIELGNPTYLVDVDRIIWN